MASTVDTTLFINAGGRGSRLSGIGLFEGEKGIPKALLCDSDGTSMIEYHIDNATEVGYSNIVVSAGDQEQVGAHIRSRYGASDRITVVESPSRNGTAADLRAALAIDTALFADTVQVVNCDTLVDIDTHGLLSEQALSLGHAVIALSRLTDGKNIGSYVVSERTKEVLSSAEFTEVPEIASQGEPIRLTSTGVVVFPKQSLLEIFDDFQNIEHRAEFSIYRDLLSRFHAMHMLSFFDNGNKFLMDIGTPDTYSFFQSSIKLRHTRKDTAA